MFYLSPTVAGFLIGDKPRAERLLERVLTDYPEALNKAAVVKRLETMKATPAAK